MRLYIGSQPTTLSAGDEIVLTYAGRGCLCAKVKRHGSFLKGATGMDCVIPLPTTDNDQVEAIMTAVAYCTGLVFKKTLSQDNTTFTFSEP